MLTQEDDVDIHALRKRGWSISAIARHVGRDRKTVRAYLEGKRQVGQRAPTGEDTFARFVDYAAARLAEDPHLWATALHDEVVKLGYDRSYPSFTNHRVLDVDEVVGGWSVGRIVRLGWRTGGRQIAADASTPAATLHRLCWGNHPRLIAQDGTDSAA